MALFIHYDEDIFLCTFIKHLIYVIPDDNLVFIIYRSATVASYPPWRCLAISRHWLLPGNGHDCSNITTNYGGMGCHVSNIHTLSVLRIFVHSVSCHFSCQKIATHLFSEKLQWSLLDCCHLTTFFQHVLDYWFYHGLKSNFLLEAGQILERSQWIQIL